MHQFLSEVINYFLRSYWKCELNFLHKRLLSSQREYCILNYNKACTDLLHQSSMMFSWGHHLPFMFYSNFSSDKIYILILYTYTHARGHSLACVHTQTHMNSMQFGVKMGTLCQNSSKPYIKCETKKHPFTHREISYYRIRKVQGSEETYYLIYTKKR